MGWLRDSAWDLGGGDDYNGQLPFGLIHLGSIVLGDVWDHKESRLLD